MSNYQRASYLETIGRWTFWNSIVLASLWALWGPKMMVKRGNLSRKCYKMLCWNNSQQFSSLSWLICFAMSCQQDQREGFDVRQSLASNLIKKTELKGNISRKTKPIWGYLGLKRRASCADFPINQSVEEGEALDSRDHVIDSKCLGHRARDFRVLKAMFWIVLACWWRILLAVTRAGHGETSLARFTPSPAPENTIQTCLFASSPPQGQKTSRRVVDQTVQWVVFLALQFVPQNHHFCTIASDAEKVFSLDFGNLFWVKFSQSPSAGHFFLHSLLFTKVDALSWLKLWHIEFSQRHCYARTCCHIFRLRQPGFLLSLFVKEMGNVFLDHLPHIVDSTGMHMDSLVINSLLHNELVLSVRTGQVLDPFGIAQGGVDFGSIWAQDCSMGIHSVKTTSTLNALRTFHRWFSKVSGISMG